MTRFTAVPLAVCIGLHLVQQLVSRLDIIVLYLTILYDHYTSYFRIVMYSLAGNTPLHPLNISFHTCDPPDPVSTMASTLSIICPHQYCRPFHRYVLKVQHVCVYRLSILKSCRYLLCSELKRSLPHSRIPIYRPKTWSAKEWKTLVMSNKDEVETGLTYKKF